ncbi:hypothetical protein LINPERPRIM_LOCUS17983 [Linum perenne]
MYGSSATLILTEFQQPESREPEPLPQADQDTRFHLDPESRKADIQGMHKPDRDSSIYIVHREKLTFQRVQCSVLMLPSVFGFPSIRTMNLANCGLGEADIPKELGTLPFSGSYW